MSNLWLRKFIGKRKSFFKSERGQSLVEATIFIPLLLLMFLGLIEVGWAIRGYLVLLSTNRETTRFATRGEYLNFGGRSIPPDEVAERVGYNVVLTHTGNILASNRLGLGLFDDGGLPLLQPLEDASQGSFIISHYYINTGAPCKLSDDPDDSNYKCTDACATEDYYEYDDDITHPGMPGYEHYLYARPESTPYASRIDPFELAEELKKENNALNCTILQRRNPAFSNPEMSVNSVVVVEAFYDQPQILGVPLLSNTFTDPILLYTQTKMRVTSDKLPQGGGCKALPIVINEDTLYNDPPNNTDLKSIGSPLGDIREGGGSGNFGWLKWRDGQSSNEEINANTNSEQYLGEGINNPLLSMYDYINPQDPDDTVMNEDDWIWGSTGQVASNGVAKEAVVEWVNGDLATIPVWDTISGSGSNVMYHIVGFALMRITSIDFQGNPKTISGTFQGWDPACSDFDN